MPVEFHVHKNGIVAHLHHPLDKASAADAGNCAVEQWNYKWTGDYGSPEFSREGPERRRKHDEVEVKKATLSADGKTVSSRSTGSGRSNQMRIRCKDLKDAGRERGEVGHLQHDPGDGAGEVKRVADCGLEAGQDHGSCPGRFRSASGSLSRYSRGRVREGAGSCERRRVS